MVYGARGVGVWVFGLWGLFSAVRERVCVCVCLGVVRERIMMIDPIADSLRIIHTILLC